MLPRTLHRMGPLVLHRQEFRGRMKEAASTGIESLGTVHRTPRMHAVCEQFLGIIRRECLDHLLILSQAHPRQVVHTWVSCFNEQRPAHPCARAALSSRASVRGACRDPADPGWPAPRVSSRRVICALKEGGGPKQPAQGP